MVKSLYHQFFGDNDQMVVRTNLTITVLLCVVGICQEE